MFKDVRFVGWTRKYGESAAAEWDNWMMGSMWSTLTAWAGDPPCWPVFQESNVPVGGEFTHGSKLLAMILTAGNRDS